MNDAFIISKEKRDELIAADSESAEIIRPILRGRDIKRYSYEFADLYIITAYKGINKIIKNTYPAVYSHLKKYEEKLRQRGHVDGKPDKQGSNQHHWTELDNNICLEKLDDLSRQKILFSEMVKIPQIYLDDDTFLVNDTVTFISGSELEQLEKFLNSHIMFSIYKIFYAGGGLGTNGVRMKKTFLQILPVPKKNIMSSDNNCVEKEIQEIIDLSDKEVAHLLKI